MSERIWLIWSNEHAAWWKPRGMGYTGIIGEAGRFSFGESVAYCEAMSRHQGADGVPKEVALLAPEAVKALMGNIDAIPVHELSK